MPNQQQDDLKLRNVLAELKDLLGPIQNNLNTPNRPSFPVASIIGNPRSGTTILLQILANSGAFAYPTNLLTRFAYAPYFGARIQQMLFDPEFDPQGDFSDLRSSLNFKSDLGKSQGALATNEFQHFFRNFIPTFWPRYLNDEDLDQINPFGIAKGLASIEYAFNQPFATKAWLLMYNIEYFYFYIPELFFLYIYRDPIYTMQSILLARERYYGSRHSWLSAQPFEYFWLKDLDIYHQVAGQVYFTNNSIISGLEKVPDKHKIYISYEELSKNFNCILEELEKKYSDLGYPVHCNKSQNKNIINKNEKKLKSKEIELLEKAYENFISGENASSK